MGSTFCRGPSSEKSGTTPTTVEEMKGGATNGAPLAAPLKSYRCHFTAVPIAASKNDWVSQDYHAQLLVIQAIALSRLGQGSEARSLITPIVDWQRGRFARNHDDAQQRLDYASALYALSLSEPAPRRNELLRQAASIIAALPEEMRSLRSTQMWKDRIAAEQAAKT